MFRNFYIETEGKEIDILKDGKLSCAAFVSTVLYLNKLISNLHATVNGTEKDLLNDGWREVEDLKSGAILIWEKKEGQDGKMHRHIGFYIGNDEAISNDSKVTGFPHRHHYTYNNTRKIELIYWHDGLND